MKRSKLDWMKDLRGADLTDGEFRVLVILMTYSDKNRRNAHPGTTRLVDDTGLSRSGIFKILASLQEKGWLLQTSQGGNQFGKGVASTYALQTPADIHKGAPEATPKGPPRETLGKSEGSTGVDKGLPGWTPRVYSDTPEGSTGVDPIRSSSSGSNPRPSIHHSDRNLSGPPGVRSPDAAGPWYCDENGYLTDESYDLLLDIVGAVDGVEESIIDGMLANGAHPQAVINTINARRTA